MKTYLNLKSIIPNLKDVPYLMFKNGPCVQTAKE